MTVNSRVKAVTAARFNTAALTGGYDLINLGGLSHACFLIRILNRSNVSLEISYDAVHTHDFIPADSSMELNFQTNSQPSNYVALMRKGQLVYVLNPNQGAGVGYIYLIGYYQE
jgi:hypothetical protein